MNNLQIKAFVAAFWKFAERIIAQLVSLIVSIILARILGPEDYSVVSLVTIFFSFANVIISDGFNSALIQKKDADRFDYSAVLWVTLCLSFVIYFLLFFFAPVIAKAYRQPILVAVIRVMGLTLPVTAVQSIWSAYISSTLQFRNFFLATIGGTVISAVVGIRMAMKGYGAWALVAQNMIKTTIDTLILILTTRIGIVFEMSLSRIRTLLDYGWKVFVSSLITRIYSEINPLIIGMKFGSSDLSFYTKGRSFPDLISSTTTNALSAVLFPVLAKVQDNREELLKGTRLFMRISSYFSFPLMLGVAVIADKFTLAVLTEKWMPAVPYIRVFCISCMFDMIHIGNCETIKAMGRSDIFLKMEIIQKTGYFITIAAFVLFARTPLELAYAFIVCEFIAIAVNCIPNKKLIDYSFSKQLSDLVPNLVISLVMSVSVYCLGLIRLPNTISLILQILTGGLIYLFLSAATKNESFIYIRKTLKNIFCKEGIS